MRFTQQMGVGQQLLDARDWTNLTLRATVVAHLPAGVRLAVHARGLRRHYALWVRPGKLTLVRQRDDQRQILARAPLDGRPSDQLTMTLGIVGASLCGEVNGVPVQCEVTEPLPPGGVAVLAEANGIDVYTLTLAPHQP